MDLPQYIGPYIAVAGIAVAISLGLLRITKIPAVVMISSALITALLFSLYARITLGYWDKFVAISFFSTAAYACAISFAMLGIGRLLRWPFFLDKKK